LNTPAPPTRRTGSPGFILSDRSAWPDKSHAADSVLNEEVFMETHRTDHTADRAASEPAQSPSNERESRTVAAEREEINVLDVLLMILKRTKLIAAITIILPILVVIIMLLMTPVYLSPARLLIPVSGASSTLAQFASAAGALGGLGNAGGPTSDMYADLLKSISILDNTLDKFGLIEFYKKDRLWGLGRFLSYNRDQARERLSDLLTITNDPTTGLIDFGVEDYDTKKSAEMSNFLVDQLTTTVNRLAFTDAGKRRQFFEVQLRTAHENLGKAEEAMKQFQERTGALQLDDQTSAMLQGIANLEATAAAKEVQLNVMKTYATENNPDMKKLQQELEALTDQLKKLEVKTSSYYPNVILPTGQIPSIGAEYLRKKRDYLFQETLYNLLLQQYESSKLDEARDSLAVQVVDRAIPAEKPVRPKKVLVAILSVGVSFFIAIFVAIVLGVIERSAEDPDNKAKLDSISAHFDFLKKPFRRLPFKKLSGPSPPPK
jgi:tyrosine-protein kinase Etk/Wzc